MVEALFGNKTAEKVLLYIENYGEGHGRAIAETFSISLTAVQKQLRKFEDGAIIVSQMKGRTRLFVWNPRCIYLQPLREILRIVLEEMPESEKKAYYRKRTRPRRTGKPL